MCVYSLLFILSNLHCLAKGVKFLFFQFFDLEIPIFTVSVICCRWNIACTWIVCFLF